MAKICEYDDVKCPFCGSENVKHYCYGQLEYQYCQTKGLTYVKVHVVRCPDCLGEFTIPCGD